MTASDIEARNDIPKVRISLYEQADSPTALVGAYKPSETEVAYSIDISVYRGYREDDAEFAELTMLDYRDAIVDWSYNLSPASFTDCNLFTWSYAGTGNVTRLKKYVTSTMTFEARKNLLQEQQTPI